MPLLSLSRVRKSFGGLRVLDGVDLAVEAGEAVGLIGPNGAGKTTLFNVISGFVRPDAGSVRLDGRELTRLAPHEVCHAGIGRTFQLAQPFAAVTVLDNVVAGRLFGAEGGMLRSLGVARAEAREVLRLVGLEGLAARRAGTLTLSERKRLELARALATRPRLLLLDEVMAGLHPSELAAMTGLLRAVRRERSLTLLLTEHNVRFVTGLSDRVTVLNYGRIIATGTPRQVVSDPEVVRAYLGERRAG